jgi:fatty-acyl-CoA synthase
MGVRPYRAPQHRASFAPNPSWLNCSRMRAYCEGKLAHYKIPRYVHVVDEFPMTVTGKVRKVEMRERSVELLGLEDVARGRHA